MPVKESSATALVRFTGLGIVCFNKDRGMGEIAAIRDDKHLLGVRIQRPVYKDGVESDLVVFEDVVTYSDLPKEDVRIEIRALSEPSVEGFEIYQSGDFDRLDSTDVNDFRWIVNMHALHAGTALSPTGGRPHPLTKIYIGNGLFYTHKLATNLFFEKVATDASGAAAGAPEPFGPVGETIGVKIEGGEVGFSISVGGRQETHTLKRVEGLPFRIEIKNMDYSETAAYSDMPDYYGYLSSPTGERFDLTPVLEDEGGGGSVNQLQFCHPLVTDLPSIDQL